MRMSLDQIVLLLIIHLYLKALTYLSDFNNEKDCFMSVMKNLNILMIVSKQIRRFVFTNMLLLKDYVVKCMH